VSLTITVTTWGEKERKEAVEEEGESLRVLIDEVKRGVTILPEEEGD